MVRKRLLPVLLLGVFFLFEAPVFAWDASLPKLRLSLQDCLKMASENNAKLEARDYSIEISRWRLKEAQARFWPVLEYNNRMAPAPNDAQNAADAFFSGDLTFFNATKFGVGMPLYAFGQLTKAQGLAKVGLEAAREEKSKDKNKIHFEVKQLYYSILLSQGLISLAQDAINKLNNQLKKEEETHQHSPYDVLKLKVFKSDLERRLDEAKTKGEIARFALKVQLGLPFEQTFEFKEAHLEPALRNLKALGDYVTMAMEERPDVNLVEIGVRAKRLEYELEKKKMFPKVGFGGFLEFARTTGEVRNLRSADDFTNPFNYTRAGVGLEVKGQLDFHGSHAKIKRLKSEYRKVSIESDLAKRGIELEIGEAYGEVKRLHENVVRAEEREKMARQMMFLSKTNLDVGVGEEQQYTDALQLVLLTRGEYLKSVFEYNIALAKLDEKVGDRQ